MSSVYRNLGNPFIRRRLERPLCMETRLTIFFFCTVNCIGCHAVSKIPTQFDDYNNNNNNNIFAKVWNPSTTSLSSSPLLSYYFILLSLQMFVWHGMTINIFLPIIASGNTCWTLNWREKLLVARSGKKKRKHTTKTKNKWQKVRQWRQKKTTLTAKMSWKMLWP